MRQSKIFIAQIRQTISADGNKLEHLGVPADHELYGKDAVEIGNIDRHVHHLTFIGLVDERQGKTDLRAERISVSEPNAGK